MGKDSGIKLAMLISGGGSTAEAIIKACKSGELQGIEPALVIASKRDIGGVGKVRTLGVPVEIVDPVYFKESALFGHEILRKCQAYKIELIGQYGWMPQTPLNVVEAYAGRMVNQHPGPLDPDRPGLDFGGPGMYGRRVHAARLYFVRVTKRDFWTEATVQRVAPEFDRGVILEQMRVRISADDDVVSLQAKVLPSEHRVQILALQSFATGNVQEWHRSEPLVYEGEVEVLRAAKYAARLLFPKG